MKHPSRVLSILLALLLCLGLLAPTAAAAANSAAPWPTADFEKGAKPWWIMPWAMNLNYFWKCVVMGGFWKDSFVVLHEGKIVHEEYGWFNNKDKPHGAFSVTKSVLSAMVGIAIGDGYINSVDDLVYDYYPEAVIAPGQESKRTMTIEHLLTMTSGLPGDDEEELSMACMFADDVGLAAFETPQTKVPGEEMMYSSYAGSQCLASLVAKAVGQNLFEYAQEKLFGPLGMTSVTWRKAPNGDSTGGFGIYMTSRDMLRFGYLYLNDGVWEDERILPEGWVEASRPPEDDFTAYGYLFWGNGPDKDWGSNYEARGLGGQFITIWPDKDIVAVRTGSSFFFRGAEQTLLDRTIP